MTLPRLDRSQVALVVWAIASLVIAMLPAGVGGAVRAVNEVTFLTLGPAFAVISVLRTLPVVVAGVIGVGVSLTTLILSSQLLLMLGIWTPWGAAVIVAATTIAFAVLPPSSSGEVSA